MITVIGVRFRTAGKIYYFDPGEFQIRIGEHVIVETARGIEYGYVVLGNREVDEKKVTLPLKPVIRMATEEDTEIELQNKIKEREAFHICQEKIRKHELEMKLIDAEYTFDNNKLLFYFTADGRIDFRELVKDLASVFRTRIELRQVGVRDETKIMGGIGICGRSLCCHSYLSDFIPVSIKMAKEQNLSLNPTKISGVCGRLMCCLKNEEETYEELNSNLPIVGDLVTTDDGLKGEVQSVNVLRQLVKVVVTNKDEKEIREYRPEQLKYRPRKRKKGGKEAQAENLEEAEILLEETEEITERAVEPSQETVIEAVKEVSEQFTVREKRKPSDSFRPRVPRNEDENKGYERKSFRQENRSERRNPGERAEYRKNRDNQQRENRGENPRRNTFGKNNQSEGNAPSSERYQKRNTPRNRESENFRPRPQGRRDNNRGQRPQSGLERNNSQDEI